MNTEGLSTPELQDAQPVVDEVVAVEVPVIEAPVPVAPAPVVIHNLDDSSLYIHRELSQLQFNIRVLEQALDESYPLLERLKFLLIFSSNLDEFFEIRVAGLKKQINFAREQAGADGLQPHQALARISELAHEQVSRQYAILNDTLLPALEKHQVRFIRRRHWNTKLKVWVRRYFRDEIAPIITPIGLDFSQALALPADIATEQRLFFYPGSSIGNLDPEAALAMLRRIHGQCAGGGLLVGVDRVKPRQVLEPAYDDALHLTAAFNLNLLRHVNSVLGADFNVDDWRHVALFNSDRSRIEMHLEARRATTVSWPGGERHFVAGERIHTENSYKFSPPAFTRLLQDAGYHSIEHWSDARGWFSVFSARA